MPRSAAPPTGQLPVTAAAAAAAALTQSITTSTPVTEAKAPRRRGHKKSIALTILLLGGAAAGVVYRDSDFAHRITGRGYDTNPLPMRSFPRPAFTGVELTYTSQSVAIDGGLPTNFWNIQRDEVNFTENSAKLTVDEAKAAIIGGSIGTAQSTSPTRELLVDQQSTYEPGATPADAWTRHPHLPGATVPALSRSEVRMYQDVVDPTLRALEPTSIVREVRHGVSVTTYTYTIPFGRFYESAPRLFDMMQILDGNAADDATVTVTVSLDGQWLVRYLDVNLDYQSVLEHRATLDPGNRYPYRFTIDVTSTTDAPVAIAIPSNVVDAEPQEPANAAAP